MDAFVSRIIKPLRTSDKIAYFRIAGLICSLPFAHTNSSYMDTRSADDSVCVRSKLTLETYIHAPLPLANFIAIRTAVD